MSKRKRIRAAKVAVNQNQLAAVKNARYKLIKPTNLLAAGVVLLIILGAVGATVGNLNRAAGVSDSAPDSPPVSPALNSALPGSPPPSPSPALRLSKEILYAGGKTLAVEDAGATGSQQQPADLVVWRRSSGTWLVRDSTDGTYISLQYGMDGDAPVPADFDGDGQSDFCVFRPNAPSPGLGSWYAQSSATGNSLAWVQFGSATDKPVPADYDGDGRADIAVWRNSLGQFIVLQSSDSTAKFISVGQIGGANQTPTPADFDGDGRADAAVWHSASGNWIIRNSSSNQVQTVQFGQANDSPVAGDYDGDGRFDQSVWRPGNNTWYYRSSANNNQTIYSQVLVTQAGDIAVQGDYDGDGKTDMAVWRPSNGYWKIQKSSTNTLRSDQWGASTDIPIAAPMKR